MSARLHRAPTERRCLIFAGYKYVAPNGAKTAASPRGRYCLDFY